MDRWAFFRRALARKGQAASMSGLMVVSAVATLSAFLSIEQAQELETISSAGESSLSDQLQIFPKYSTAAAPRSRQAGDTGLRPTGAAAPVNRIDALTERQRNLETTLTDQPLEALDIPLLRRDLDNQAKDVATLTAALQKAEESQWETMRWLIGGLAAAIAAICIPIVGRLFHKDRPPSGRA